MRINSTTNTSFQGLWESIVKQYRGTDSTHYLRRVIKADVTTYRPFKDEEITPELKNEIEKERSFYCEFYEHSGDYYNQTVREFWLIKTTIGKPLNFTEEEYKNLSSTLANAKKKQAALREVVPYLADVARYADDEKAREIYYNALKTAEEDSKNTPYKIRELEKIADKYVEKNPFTRVRTEKTRDHKYEELSEYKTEQLSEDVHWDEKLPDNVYIRKEN